ncbi:MAG: ferritin-like domain-containing protein [Candidatus Binataceae bacterium]|nr:ferritin-like domain-containing protein [Candidatus Binataceae bacterium]
MSIDTHFDLDRYLALSGATKPAIFDWSAPQPALDSETLFCLGYMMDIESHTIVYMRELLSTRVIRDPAVTAFLSCWAYEEFFHSLLLRRLLAQHGVSIDDRRFAELRTRRSLHERVIGPVAAIISRLTRHFPAVHMTWGALNEISTLAGYQALLEYAERDSGGRPRNGEAPAAGGSLLSQILLRIAKDERRHFAFYFQQARTRLHHRGAQRLTNFLLRRFWRPVGSSVRGDPDARRVCAVLFQGAAGSRRLGQIDATVARLPGLEWFNLAAARCTGG